MLSDILKKYAGEGMDEWLGTIEKLFSSRISLAILITANVSITVRLPSSGHTGKAITYIHGKLEMTYTRNDVFNQVIDHGIALVADRLLYS